MAKIVHFKPQPLKGETLNPELQTIFNELPNLIDYCERNGQRLAEQIIEEIKEEIAIQPEQREQIILSHRDKLVKRYKELINSGLRLKATDKEEILQKIGLIMFASGTWEIPMPKDCSFSSIKPDPKGYLHTAIAPIFYHYATIQACNNLLNPQATDTTETPVPETETTEQKIKRILEPLQEAFDTPGHLDLIVKALAEYSDTGNLPVKAERKIIQKDNRDFYPYFKKLKNETRLTVPGIASVLVYFIWQNNGSGGLISPGTIEKNIKQNYPKL